MWNGDHNIERVGNIERQTISGNDLYIHHYTYPYSQVAMINRTQSDGLMLNPIQSEMYRHDLERRQRMENMMETEKAKHRLIKQEEEEIYYLLT